MYHTEFESKDKSIVTDHLENSIKHKLEDIENFVRDDYKASFLNSEDKILEEIDYVMKHSIAEKFSFSYFVVLSTACLVMIF